MLEQCCSRSGIRRRVDKQNVQRLPASWYIAAICLVRQCPVPTGCLSIEDKDHGVGKPQITS